MGSGYTHCMTKLALDDPYTLETAVTVELADAIRVNDVLDRARAAFAKFRGTSVKQRMDLVERATAAMEKRTDEIASDISKMMGKPVAQGRGEVGGMAQRARHMISI